ncbi:MAG: sugar phosphate isomerase/epimerase [Endomicrobia bacterium]|nr:sugar phosphate isomerase/epimerase [Endomicrobiia bacterium]
MKLGISTIYFSKKIIKKEISWQQIKDTLLSLNINAVELNADIPLDWLKLIYNDVINKNITILSMHNFCPAVDNLPEGRYGYNAYSLNSTDDNERELAVKYTLRTIEYAQYLNAGTVVLHSGEIPTQPSGFELYKFALQFSASSELYKKYKLLLEETRNKNKRKYMELLYSSLDKILKFSEEKKIKLSLETRLLPNEIPNFEEIEEILNYYKSEYLSYWHDFGHVEIQNKLGFSPHHNNYFDNYYNKLSGYHIHNVINLEDHYAKNKGDIDFVDLLKYNEKKIYILEVHSKESLTELKKFLKFIKSILSNKYERIPS